MVKINIVFIVSVFVALIYGCNKNEVITDTWKNNKNIIFNPNLTYGSLIDIDGNIYKTIQIGSQTWMAENLKTTKYNDGTLIPNIDGTEWNNLTTPSFCWYRMDSADYKSNYGALYNWYAVNTGKLAPKGWHIPTITEWNAMTLYIAIKSDISNVNVGGKLKEAGTIHWNNPNTSATNDIGFTALPGGGRFQYDTGYDMGKIGYWWTSTESNQHKYMAYNITMYYNDIIIGFGGTGSNKYHGMSVRCIKD